MMLLLGRRTRIHIAPRATSIPSDRPMTFTVGGHHLQGPRRTLVLSPRTNREELTEAEHCLPGRRCPGLSQVTGSLLQAWRGQRAALQRRVPFRFRWKEFTNSSTFVFKAYSLSCVIANRKTLKPKTETEIFHFFHSINMIRRRPALIKLKAIPSKTSIGNL